MQYCINNKLSYQAIEDLLKLLGILCPPDNLLPKTFYKFKKFFQQFQGDHDLQQICMKCKEKTCSCYSHESSDIAHLVHVDIHKPLRTIISGNFFAI